MNSITSILRKASERPEHYKILTGDTHEAYQTNMSKTNDIFYGLQHQAFKKWNDKFRPLPDNYTQIENLNVALEFDFVLSQNKFGQFQVFKDIANRFNLPLVSLEHTLPMPGWPQSHLDMCTSMRGHLNVFISEYSVQEWGFSLNDPTVRIVRHGIDTDLFKPIEVERDNTILSVVNDWINRDVFCGFNLYKETIVQIPNGTKYIKILGDTPGLSLPAKNQEELVSSYQSSRIFLNTSLVSPIPTVLMEAMSSGCAVVSTNNCMIPEVVQHGYNGLLANTSKELAEHCQLLLNDKNLAETLGNNARKTIVEKYNQSLFINNWKNIFHEAYNTVFKDFI